MLIQARTDRAHDLKGLRAHSAGKPAYFLGPPLDAPERGPRRGPGGQHRRDVVQEPGCREIEAEGKVIIS